MNEYKNQSMFPMGANALRTRAQEAIEVWEGRKADAEKDLEEAMKPLRDKYRGVWVGGFFKGKYLRTDEEIDGFIRDDWPFIPGYPSRKADLVQWLDKQIRQLHRLIRGATKSLNTGETSPVYLTMDDILLLEKAEKKDDRDQYHL